HDAAQRGIIDEQRVTPVAPDADKLRADFKAGLLTEIPAGKSTIVYTEFNNGGRAEVDRSKGKYLIVSMDGQITVTDGTVVEPISCTWTKTVRRTETDVVMPFPVTWKTKQDKEKLDELPLPGGSAAVPESAKRCKGAVVA